MRGVLWGCAAEGALWSFQKGEDPAEGQRPLSIFLFFLFFFHTGVCFKFFFGLILVLKSALSAILVGEL